MDMTKPVYDGMPSRDTTFEVPKASGEKGGWGTIRCGGLCRDDYDRIQIWDQPPEGGSPVKLQRAALDSFRAADADVKERTGKRIRLTGSWRSCAYQTDLYKLDRNRYAPPNTTAHCRGLAIDVNNDMLEENRYRSVVAEELSSRGWHQARPTDERWHWSFGIQV